MWRVCFSPKEKANSKKAQGKFEQKFLDDMHVLLENIANTHDRPESIIPYHFEIGFVSTVYEILHDRLYGE